MGFTGNPPLGPDDRGMHAVWVTSVCLASRARTPWSAAWLCLGTLLSWVPVLVHRLVQYLCLSLEIRIIIYCKGLWKLNLRPEIGSTSSLSCVAFAHVTGTLSAKSMLLPPQLKFYHVRFLNHESSKLGKIWAHFLVLERAVTSAAAGCTP